MTVVALVASASATELIQDGGFESGAFSPNWTASASSGNVTVTTAQHFQGTHSARFLVDNVDGANGSLSQFLPSITPLADISSFTAFVKTAGQTIEMDIEDGKGGLHTFTKTFAFNEGWQPWNILTQIKGGNLDQISQIEFTINGHNGGGGHDLYLDNVSLQTQPVPEPCTMIALGGGALAMAVRRRKASVR